LKKADQLRARTDSPEIEFAVLMENGKARLKARRKT